MNGRNTGTSRAVGCSPRPSAQSNSSVNGGRRPCHTSSTASTSSPKASANACLASRALIPTRSAPVASFSSANRPEASRWSSIEASTCGRIQTRCRAQPLDCLADRNGRIVDFRRLVQRLGPQQSDRFGHVADIVAAHVEQHRIDPLLCNRAHRRALHRRDVERSGQRREAIAAVGIGRFLEVIADQLELGVARARVDEIVEQLREGAHRASNARTGLGA